MERACRGLGLERPNADYALIVVMPLLLLFRSEIAFEPGLTLRENAVGTPMKTSGSCFV